MATSTRGNHRIAVGVFSNREDAYRAMVALRNEGFSSSQIGAAFRHEGEFSGTGVDEDSTMRRISDRDPEGPGVTGVGSGASGVASGSQAVTPAGLSTGAGTTTTGAGRPGPIPGSHIPHRKESTRPASSPAVPNAYPSTGSFSTTEAEEARRGEGDSWWAKIRNLFSDEDTRRAKTAGMENDTSLNFGTGQGHLGTMQPAATVPQSQATPYRPTHFADSLEKLGIENEAARYYSRMLPPGGAVLTVRGGDALKAETTMAQNGARIYERSASSSSMEGDVALEEGRSSVYYFGEFEHPVPGRDSTLTSGGEYEEEVDPPQEPRLRRPA